MKIYCCGCANDANARLTSGREIYPHRKDLYKLPFWKCDMCGNYVGCHYKTKKPTTPLGCIPTPEIKNARQHVHKILDPLWRGVKRKRAARKRIYEMITAHVGWKYHTASIRSVEEAREIYRFIKSLNEVDTV